MIHLSFTLDLNMNEKEQARVKDFSDLKKGWLYQIGCTTVDQYPNLGSFLHYDPYSAFYCFNLFRPINGNSLVYVPVRDLLFGEEKLYKLNPIPLHEQIKDMLLEEAESFLIPLIGFEVCPFIEDHNGVDPILLDRYYSRTLMSNVFLGGSPLSLHVVLVDKEKNWTDYTYKHPRIIEIGSIYTYDTDSVECLIKPKNNQGRETCFWCQNPTKKVEGFSTFYDVCPKCGK